MIILYVFREYHNRELVGFIITCYESLTHFMRQRLSKQVHFLNLGSVTIEAWMWACFNGSSSNVASPRLGGENQV